MEGGWWMWRKGGCGERMDVKGGLWMWRKGGCEGRVVDVEGGNTSACSRYTLLATCTTATTVSSDDDNHVSTGAGATLSTRSNGTSLYGAPGATIAIGVTVPTGALLSPWVTPGLSVLALNVFRVNV